MPNTRLVIFGATGDLTRRFLVWWLDKQAAGGYNGKGEIISTFLSTETNVDVVVWERSRFERRARVTSSLPAVVLREGRLLYAA